MFVLMLWTSWEVGVPCARVVYECARLAMCSWNVTEPQESRSQVSGWSYLPCRCPLQEVELLTQMLDLRCLHPLSTSTGWLPPFEVSLQPKKKVRDAAVIQVHHHLLARHRPTVAMGLLCEDLLALLLTVDGLVHSCLLPCHHKWQVCHHRWLVWFSFLRSPCLRSNRTSAFPVVCIVIQAQSQWEEEVHMLYSCHIDLPCHMLHSCHSHRHSPAVESARSSPMVSLGKTLHGP